MHDSPAWRRPFFEFLLFLSAVSAAAQSAVAQQVAAPIPAAADQAGAAKKISEVYGARIASARTPELKKSASEELARAADETRNDVALRYALYEKAQDLAVAAGDDLAAVRIQEKLFSAFDHGRDLDTLRRQLYVSLSKATATRSTLLRMAARLAALSDVRLDRDDYDAAIAAAHAAGDAARVARDAPGLQRAVLREQLLRTMKADYDELLRRLAGPIPAPNDPGENGVAGRYYCLTKNQWSKGLPLLARGSDEQLRDLAKQELADSKTSSEFAALSRGWSSAAETESGLARDIMRLHAAYWLRKALPSLGGLDKAKAEKQLADWETPKGPVPVGDGLVYRIEILHEIPFTLSAAKGRVQEIVVVVPRVAAASGTLEIVVVNMGDNSGDGGMHCELRRADGLRAFRQFGRSDRTFTYDVPSGTTWLIVLEDQDTGGGGNGGSVRVWFTPK